MREADTEYAFASCADYLLGLSEEQGNTMLIESFDNMFPCSLLTPAKICFLGFRCPGPAPVHLSFAVLHRDYSTQVFGEH